MYRPHDAFLTLIDEGLVSDAIVAQSARERDALWALRDDLMPGYAPLRPFASYDVGMAIADMPVFVERAKAGVCAHFPDAVMRTLKAALDPAGILNPGKLLSL
ncbi:MAG TPA: FAD-linked oxidase C-terminal domain-containing protein [Sphingobium sp.]